MSAPALDLADIQGDILRAYGNAYDCTSYAFVQIDCEPERARDWFAGLLDHVTTAEPWRSGKPLTTLNVALTAAGVRALGVSDEVAGSFAIEFRAGMRARAGLLGDVGASSPDKWERGLGTGDAHVLLTINAQSTADHRRALGKMQAAMKAAGGVGVVFQQDAELLADAREHFGFADGFAQPAIAGATEDKVAGGGIPERDGAWRSLAAGRVRARLPRRGHARRPRAAPAAGAGRPAGQRRDVHGVAQALPGRGAVAAHDAARGRALRRRRRAPPRGEGRRALAQRAPLSLRPNAPGASFDAAEPGANDFRYGDDLEGRRCPLGAHIRRSNPRDALGHDGTLSMRHRMIRRGMPYGPPLPEGSSTTTAATAASCS